MSASHHRTSIGSGLGHDGELGESISDTVLLEQIQAGRAEAWEILVERYERLVFSVARGNGLSTDDAMDVTQSTFLALLESMAALRAKDRVAWWLMTVARRHSWRLRTRNRKELVRAEPLPEDAVTVHDWEQTITVHQAVAQMEQPCRDLVVALFFDPNSPSYGQIAKQLGRSVGSIGPLRGRCLERLRAQLGEQDWS